MDRYTRHLTQVEPARCQDPTALSLTNVWVSSEKAIASPTNSALKIPQTLCARIGTVCEDYPKII
ncbi:hypothetical protein [Nostoc sp. FACHB-110]|uniref:hypothetical protein n=1 Tax=Nostoc sp. FACHB-110 TaxID=2692834 RepID=UPI001688E007|nr:hypothetical protein [Nostoc sp. FACHB-110]MBD2437475.1 hypothetical protein [Nostoc sp. FACHB-110]